jgi:MerR family transcriptional regulator, light-induced transcriptional regulator
MDLLCDKKSIMQYFNIRVASQLSGVAAATIRAWEKRYNAVEPTRGENGHRLYSEIDIEKLFKLTEIGQSIGKIANLKLEELKNVYETVFQSPYDQKKLVSIQAKSTDYHEILNNLFLALSAYKVDILSHELEKARNELSPKELSLNILLPLFYEVGVRVESKKLTIAQERTISALATFYLGQVIGSHYKNFSKKNDLFLIATPEGELHEVGILAAALLCVHYGLKFIMMGASVPAESLSEAANALKCKYIILGTTREELRSNYNLNQYVQNLKNNLHDETKIFVGGNISQNLKQELHRQKVGTFSTMQSLDEFLSKI